MKKSRKVFIICPVRKATADTQRFLASYVQALKEKGCLVHYPLRDTNQNDPIGNKICEENFKAILAADEIHVFYDKNSTGVHFDLGGVFMLTQILGKRKKIVFINRYERAVLAPGKSFLRLLAFLEEHS